MHPEILVAATDMNTAHLINSYLVSTGYPVVLATGADSLWEMIRSKRPALALITADLPGLPQILARVRTDPNLAYLPVLVLGDAASPAQAADWLIRGADDYVRQPVSARLLSALVLAKLRRRGRNGDWDSSVGSSRSA
jgi:DNA-binding response OmpR family regulator